MLNHHLFSNIFATTVGLAFLPLGCGGANDDYVPVSRPQEAKSASSSDQYATLSETESQKFQACMMKNVGNWFDKKYTVRYDAKADEHGALKEVQLRDTTLPENVETCFREVIAAMTLPEQMLRRRSAGPVSGGEKITRERRGALGESDSQNPFVIPFILEMIGIDVVIEIFVGTIAAVGTIVTSKKKKNECLDKYVACMDSPLGNIQVDVIGTTVCASCKTLCDNDGFWPAGFKGTHKWHTCR